MTTGTAKKILRTRSGDNFLIAILIANLLCGVVFIAALRADLSKDLVASESALASSKISAYLWGKILRFTLSMEKGRWGREAAPFKWDIDEMTVVEDIPADWNLQRIRSGRGEELPIFMGTPRDLRTADTFSRSASLSPPADRGRTNATSSGRFPSRTLTGTSGTFRREEFFAESSIGKDIPCSSHPGGSRLTTLSHPGSRARFR